MLASKVTGKARLGLAVAALAAICVPAGRIMAQDAASADKLDSARIAKGRELFASWGCSSCHALADADSHGDVGPHLDGANLTETFIVSRVTNGQGAMPSFKDQLTEEQIAEVAAYVSAAAGAS